MMILVKTGIINQCMTQQGIGRMVVLLFLLSACSNTNNSAGSVDGRRILLADREPGNWMSHGRTYDEQRYSPLSQIGEKNIARLGLSWRYDFETHRGLEATPLVVDGVMYVTGSWSRVYALDAANGQLIWQHDPKVPPEWAVNACCDVVNHGVVSTAGNLLFQGNGAGYLVAYSADSGKELWSFDAQTGIVAAPITYRVGDEQYVAVLAGWGGAMPLVQGGALTHAANRNISRILVFKLDGKETLPEIPPLEIRLDPPANTASAEAIMHGKALYHRTCFACHGDTAVSGGVIPDLRYTSQAMHKLWDEIVLGGLLKSGGMVGFSQILSAEDSRAIQSYVIERALDAKAEFSSGNLKHE